MDGALELGCRVAGRLLVDRPAPNETAPKLAERARAASRELVKPSPASDSARLTQTPEELFKVLLRELLDGAGRGDYWTTERVLRSLVAGLVLRAGPMVLTGGQTPGQVLLGVRVVRLDGRPPTAGQALVREFGPTALSASLDLWPLTPALRGAARLTLLAFMPAVRFLNSERRSYADVLAGTRVV